MTTLVIQRGARRFAISIAALSLMAAACGTSDDSDEGASPTSSAPPPTSSTEADPADALLAAVPPAALTADATTDCPGDYADEAPIEGENLGFMSADQERSFHLLLPPDDFEGPRPVFLAFTGTVQEELNFLEQSEIDQLPEDGWIVVAPVRNDNGILWPPWDAMRTPPIADDPNPDMEFFTDVIACVAAHHEVDENRIYAGGISIGGTMTNYLLQRESELFAGGIAGSGNFITTSPNEPQPLGDMVVIVAWGGDNDEWTGCPDGSMGEDAAGEDCVGPLSFVADASLASQFYDAEPAVEQVACTMDLGHIWLTAGTEYMAAVLLAHPKGLPGEFVLPEATPSTPEEFSCTTDPFIAEGVSSGGAD